MLHMLCGPHLMHRHSGGDSARPSSAEPLSSTFMLNPAVADSTNHYDSRSDAHPPLLMVYKPAETGSGAATHQGGLQPASHQGHLLSSPAPWCAVTGMDCTVDEDRINETSLSTGRVSPASCLTPPASIPPGGAESASSDVDWTFERDLDAMTPMISELTLTVPTGGESIVCRSASLPLKPSRLSGADEGVVGDTASSEDGEYAHSLIAPSSPTDKQLSPTSRRLQRSRPAVPSLRVKSTQRRASSLSPIKKVSSTHYAILQGVGLRSSKLVQEFLPSQLRRAHGESRLCTEAAAITMPTGEAQPAMQQNASKHCRLYNLTPPSP